MVAVALQNVPAVSESLERALDTRLPLDHPRPALGLWRIRVPRRRTAASVSPRVQAVRGLGQHLMCEDCGADLRARRRADRRCLGILAADGALLGTGDSE